MLKKSKKVVSLLLAVVICFTLPLSVFAATGPYTFGVDTSKGFIDLTIRGWQGTAPTSNPVYFTVKLDGKIIKNITVQVGTSTMSGAIIGQTMTLENISIGYESTVAWSGGNNTSVTFSDFDGQDATGTYKLTFKGLVISNTLGNPIFGTPDMEAIRGYKGTQIKLIIECY